MSIKNKIDNWGKQLSVLEGIDRLQYLVDLADKETSLASDKRINANMIPGCVSQIWVDVRLENLISIEGRIGWKGLKTDEYVKDGPMFLSVHSLNYGDVVDYSQVLHIPQWRYDESPGLKLQNNDILLAKDGAGIGKIGIVSNLRLGKAFDLRFLPRLVFAERIIEYSFRDGNRKIYIYRSIQTYHILDAILLKMLWELDWNQ